MKSIIKKQTKKWLTATSSPEKKIFLRCLDGYIQLKSYEHSHCKITCTPDGSVFTTDGRRDSFSANEKKRSCSSSEFTAILIGIYKNTVSEKRVITIEEMNWENQSEYCC